MYYMFQGRSSWTISMFLCLGWHKERNHIVEDKTITLYSHEQYGTVQLANILLCPCTMLLTISCGCTNLYLFLSEVLSKIVHYHRQLLPVDESIAILGYESKYQYLYLTNSLSKLTPSNTWNAPLISSSEFSISALRHIIMRNSGKSMLPVPSLSTWFTMS